MEIDKHFDSVTNLEKDLLSQLEGITQQLRGKITYTSYGNSQGKSSKIVTIEYDIKE